MRVDGHAHAIQESWFGEPWWQGVAAVGAAMLPGVTPDIVRDAILPAYWDADGSSQLGAQEAAGIDVAVLLTVDWTAEHHLGAPATGWREQNAWFRDFAAANPDRVRWGFGADPRQEGALEAFETAVRDEGAVALKLHPSGGFAIDDPVVYPFMETARALSVPVVIHTGPSIAPLYSKWSEPILLDTLAADFPDVRIQAAHTGNASWQAALAVASVKPNVYGDLSGWQSRWLRNPARFYADVREVLDTVGAHRVMWGTDAPYYRALVSDDDWLRAITDAPEGALRPDESAWIAGDTAAAFYGLA